MNINRIVKKNIKFSDLARGDFFEWNYALCIKLDGCSPCLSDGMIGRINAKDLNNDELICMLLNSLVDKVIIKDINYEV
jgi:hypothetical protein